MSKAPNKSPTVEREEWLRDALLPWAERHFAENPKDQSLILSVAQYWADEASDAVHAHAIASTRLIPRWPGPNWEDHDATAEDRSVSLWSSSEERLPWDSNGGAIRPFQALCGEIGSQDLTYDFDAPTSPATDFQNAFDRLNRSSGGQMWLTESAMPQQRENLVSLAQRIGGIFGIHDTVHFAGVCRAGNRAAAAYPAVTLATGRGCGLTLVRRDR